MPNVIQPGGSPHRYRIHPANSSFGQNPWGTAAIQNMTKTWKWKGPDRDQVAMPATMRAFEALPHDKRHAIASRWYATSPKSTLVPRFADINRYDAGLIGADRVRFDKIVEGNTPSDEYAMSPEDALRMHLRPTSWGTAAKIAAVAALLAVIVYVMAKSLQKRDDDQ